MAFAPLAGGVWQVLPTPFRGREDAVDHDSLRRVVDHGRAVGVNGFVALGVLGEAARLDSGERSAVLETVVAAARGLPVVAGVSAIATAPAVEDASCARQAGATAVMLLVASAAEARLAEHLRTVSDAVGLGVVVQDHPAATGVVIAPAALVRAVESAGVVVAVKAESPPTAATVAAVTAGTQVPAFGGLGGVGLLDELAAGAAGAMTGFAFPEALVRAVHAYRSEGFSAARAALAPYMPIIVSEAQLPISLALRKAIMHRRGLLAERAVRFPGAPLPEWAEHVLEEHLDGLA